MDPTAYVHRPNAFRTREWNFVYWQAIVHSIENHFTARRRGESRQPPHHQRTTRIWGWSTLPGGHRGRPLKVLRRRAHLQHRRPHVRLLHPRVRGFFYFQISLTQNITWKVRCINPVINLSCFAWFFFNVKISAKIKLMSSEVINIVDVVSVHVIKRCELIWHQVDRS